MKAPKHYAVKGPPSVLTLAELVEEPWATPNPWSAPFKVDQAVETIEEWIPNDKGILAKAELPILEEPDPVWEPYPEPVTLDIGSTFKLSGDLWKPLPAGHYIGFHEVMTTASVQKMYSYLSQALISPMVTLPSYQLDAQTIQGQQPYLGGFVSPSYLTSEMVYGGHKTADKELAELVPALKAFYPSPPCQCGVAVGGYNLANMIVHLNDRHEWTREQIADWLDTLDLDLTFQPASRGD